MSNNKNCKIYSRSRIKIFKNKKLGKKNYKKKYIYIIIIIIIFVLTYILIEKTINSIFEETCQDEANAIATRITNEETTRAMQGYTYNDMFTIERDESGEIQMINANIITIDEITSNISNYIQEALENSETQNIRISIGSLTGIKILSATGPSIPIKILTSGRINTELKSEFLAKGINQTIHRVYLQIDCQISVLTPFESIKENVSNQVLLLENVIIGNIPENYYNFEGLENVKDSMETIK